MLFNIILLTIVCFAPLLNIAFDYFLLYITPSKMSIITALTTIILYFVVLIRLRKIYYEDKK